MNSSAAQRKAFSKRLMDEVFAGLKRKYFRRSPFNPAQSRWINIIIESRLNDLKAQAKIDAPQFDTFVVAQFKGTQKNGLDHYLDCAECLRAMLKRSNNDPNYPAAQIQIVVDSMAAIEQQINTLLILRNDKALSFLLNDECPEILSELKTIRHVGIKRWSRAQLSQPMRVNAY